MLPAGSIQVAGSPLKIAGDTRHDLDQVSIVLLSINMC